MPKENRSSSRRSRRHSLDANEETASSRDLLKSTIGGNRFSPFQRETPRRELRQEKESMALTHAEILYPRGTGIIESGIKYIMLPLHLLRFCIFGTTTTAATLDDPTETHSEKSRKEERRESEEKRKKEEVKESRISRRDDDVEEKKERKEEDRKKEDRRDKETVTSNKDEEQRGEKEAKKSTSSSRRRSSSPSPVSRDEHRGRTSDSESRSRRSLTTKKSSQEIVISDDDFSDEMVTAAEDSDSSSDYWSSANSIMNMSLDYDQHLEKSMSFTVVEEPMDVSMEEHQFEKSGSVAKESRECRSRDNSKDSRSKTPPRSSVDQNERKVYNSVDEEIARIFQKQCTSSDDELPSAPSRSASQRIVNRQNNSRCFADSDASATGSRAKKTFSDNENEDDDDRKKKTSDEFAIHKRRKTSRDNETNLKKTERRSEERTNEEETASRQGTPSKRRSRSLRTPVRSKETKRREVKYKESSTQTDSAFSDEDVEMIPVEAKLQDKRLSAKSSIRKPQSHLFQMEQMDHDLEYIADNEDSNDGCGKIRRPRISSSSTSSSSTDLGFEERGCTTPDMDFPQNRWHTYSPDSIAKERKSTIRAPPGFPQHPQNPPLTTSQNSKDAFLLAAVPPAPTPMRHLYYDYPEFMDHPEGSVNASKILQNILRNNYYQ